MIVFEHTEMKEALNVVTQLPRSDMKEQVKVMYLGTKDNKKDVIKAPRNAASGPGIFATTRHIQQIINVPPFYSTFYRCEFKPLVSTFV
jgi:hypothetical protein